MAKHDYHIMIVSDPHVGGSTSLSFPNKRWSYGDHKRSKTFIQTLIQKQWRSDFHHAHQVRKKNPDIIFIVVLLGDLIEGSHHVSKQVITNDLEEQKAMFVATFIHALKFMGWQYGKDKLFIVRGTDTHVGEHEESIGRLLTGDDVLGGNGKYLATPHTQPTAENEWMDGRFSWDKLVLNKYGVKIDLAHHGIAPGGRAWTKNNGAINVAKDYYWTYLEDGRTIPDYIVRAHRHKYVRGVYNGKHKDVVAFVNPSYQFKTHFGHRVATKELSDIGCTHIQINKDGTHNQYVSMMQFSDIDEGNEVTI
jgi:hypothetical protein